MTQQLKNLLRGLKSLIWPEKKLLFAGLGSILGFSADFSSFLTNFASPMLWMALAGALTVVFGLICTPKIFRSSHKDEAEVEAASKCLECDLLRTALFTTLGLAALVIIGQGQTATEQIGRQLGVIEDKVDTVIETTERIEERTEAIDETTTAIRDVTSAAEIIRSPKTPEEFYRNAFIYSYMRQNPAAGWEAIQALYDKFGPRKMDAADLYYTYARQNLPRDQMFAQMVEIGRKYSDPTLLVVVARNETDRDKSEALYAEARSMDPDLASAYWDLQRVDFSGGVEGIRNPAAQVVRTRASIELIKGAIAASGRKPQAQYYFQPQFAPDVEGLLHQTLANTEILLDSQEKLARQLAPR